MAVSESVLTPKQREVLVGLKAGDHPSKIAEDLGISTNGVYQHMKRIREAKISFPEPERKPPGRPKGKSTGKRRGRPPKASRIGVVGDEAAAAQREVGGEAAWDGEAKVQPPQEVTIEQATELVALGIDTADKRLVEIDGLLDALGKEKEELTARRDKLAKAGEVLA